MKTLKKDFHEEFIDLLNQLDKNKLFALYYMLVGYMQGVSKK